MLAKASIIAEAALNAGKKFRMLDALTQISVFSIPEIIMSLVLSSVGTYLVFYR